MNIDDWPTSPFRTFQMAVTLQWFIRSPPWLVLGWGFQGRWIERCCIRVDQIQDSGLAILKISNGHIFAMHRLIHFMCVRLLYFALRHYTSLFTHMAGNYYFTRNGSCPTSVLWHEEKRMREQLYRSIQEYNAWEVYIRLVIIYRVRLKNDPTPKMWYLSNPLKFLRQILCACLAGLWPLTCCFSLKLLYVYEIGIKSNLKFGFCSYTCYFLCDATFRTIIAKFTD